MSALDDFSNLDQQTVLLLQRLKQLNGEISKSFEGENSKDAPILETPNFVPLNSNLDSNIIINEFNSKSTFKDFPKDNITRDNSESYNTNPSYLVNSQYSPYNQYKLNDTNIVPKSTFVSEAIPSNSLSSLPSRLSNSLSALKNSIQMVKESNGLNKSNIDSNYSQPNNYSQQDIQPNNQFNQANATQTSGIDADYLRSIQRNEDTPPKSSNEFQLENKYSSIINLNDETDFEEEDVIIIDSTEMEEDKDLNNNQKEINRIYSSNPSSNYHHSSETPNKSPLTRKSVSPNSVETDRLQNYHQLKNLFSDKMKPPKEFIAMHKEALSKINILEEENRDLIRHMKQMEETLVEFSENQDKVEQDMEELKSKYRNKMDAHERMFKDKEQLLKNKLGEREQRILDLEGKIVELQDKIVTQAINDQTDESFIEEKDNIIRNLEDNLRGMTKVLQTVKKENKTLQGSIHRKELELDQQRHQVLILNSNIENKDEDVDKLHKQLDSYKERIDEYNAYIHTLREKTENLNRTIQNQNTEIENLKKNSKQYKSQASELQESREKYEDLRIRFENYVEQIKNEELEREESNDYIKKYKEIINHKDVEINALQNALQSLKKDKSRVEAQFLNYRENNKELQNEALIIHEKVQEMKNRYLEMIAQRDDLQNRLNDLLKIKTDTSTDERIKNLESLLDTTSNQLSETRKELSKIKEDNVELEQKYNKNRTLHTEFTAMKIKADEALNLVTRYKSQYEEIFIKYSDLQTQFADLEREFEEYKLNELSASDFGIELKKQNEMLHRELVELRSRHQDEIDDQRKKEDLFESKQALIDEKISEFTQEISQLKYENQDYQNKLNALNIEKNVQKERFEKREKEYQSQIDHLKEIIKDLKHQQATIREENSKIITKLTEERSELEVEIRKIRSDFQTERKSILAQEMELSEKEKTSLRTKYQNEIASLQRQISQKETEISSLKNEVSHANRSRNEEIAEMRIQMKLLEHSNRYKEMYDDMKTENPILNSNLNPNLHHHLQTPNAKIQSRSSLSVRSTPIHSIHNNAIGSVYSSPYVNRSTNGVSTTPYKSSFRSSSMNQTY